MTARSAVTLTALLLLVACKAYEGEYAPGCIAYAGSRISLDSGRFVWDRFTDQVTVDADGNVVDPYPDYPKHGTYTIEGDAVIMATESGESMETLYLHRDGDRHRLLTAEQDAEWKESGAYADCVLTLSAASGS